MRPPSVSFNSFALPGKIEDRSVRALDRLALAGMTALTIPFSQERALVHVGGFSSVRPSRIPSRTPVGVTHPVPLTFPLPQRFFCASPTAVLAERNPRRPGRRHIPALRRRGFIQRVFVDLQYLYEYKSPLVTYRGETLRLFLATQDRSPLFSLRVIDRNIF